MSQCTALCPERCAEGKIAAFLEERLNVGVNFVLSAEGGLRLSTEVTRHVPLDSCHSFIMLLPSAVDHPRKDYKFGFGLTVGE